MWKESVIVKDGAKSQLQPQNDKKVKGAKITCGKQAT